MNSIAKGMAAASIAALVTGCASSTEPPEEMTQLNRAEVMALFAGNSVKQPLLSGEGTFFAAYNEDISAGGAKAYGPGWLHVVSFTSTLSEEGEICSVFDGEYNWSKPELEYCNVVKQSASGKMYRVATNDPSNRNQTGKRVTFKVMEGDPSGLLPDS